MAASVPNTNTRVGYQRRGRPGDLGNDGRGKRELELPRMPSLGSGKGCGGDAKTSIAERRCCVFTEK